MPAERERGGRRASRRGRKTSARRTPAEHGSRRPASHIDGAIEVQGETELAGVLRTGFEDVDARDPDDLTHGFHSYPARMHPGIAAALLGQLTRAGSVVLDPFCGSGTVLVESRVAGVRAYGVDLHPLALRIAEVRCERRGERARQRFAARVDEVAASSQQRVRGRVPVQAPLSRQEARWYDPHVLKELAGLREEIREVPSVGDRRALEMVLSAIVVKFSRQRADTAERTAPKRIRKGLPTEFFARKGHELVERWAAFDAMAAANAPAARRYQGDARRLRDVLPRDVRADVVVTSPPYGGTYDYVAHHARRYPWLDLDTSGLERGELGARRSMRGRDAASRWDAQVRDALRAMAQVMRPDGVAVLVVGDAQLGRRRIAADSQLQRVAPRAGLRVCARASQPRPDWTGGSPRREHLIALGHR